MYKFETEHFAVSDTGVHLLRSRFNYETIGFETIKAVDIKGGKELKNWRWVLFIGVALIAFVVFDLYQIYQLFISDGTFVIYVERLLIPLFPLLVGGYSIIISLRSTVVFTFKTDKKSYYLSLRELVKDNSLERFRQFVEDKRKAVKSKNLVG